MVQLTPAYTLDAPCSPHHTMNRRHVLPAIAAALVACGEGVRRATAPEPEAPPPPEPEPCPTCGPKEPPETEPEPVPDPPAPPYLGIEYLAQLSLRESDPAEAVRVLAEHGIDVHRTFTVLPRWGPGPAPEPGWYVDPLMDGPEYFDRMGAWVEACKEHGVIGQLCLFDTPDRWKSDARVRPIIERDLIDPASATTWLDDAPGWPAARELAEFYLDGIEPSPWLVTECTNEPGDWPSGFQRPPDDRLAAWLRGKGYRVARGTALGSDGPYMDAEWICEHAFGRPNVAQPTPPYARLEALQRAHPDAHIWYSTDGHSIDDYPEQGEHAGEVLNRGFSFSGLVRTPPDLWSAETRRAVDRMAGAAVRSTRAA